MKTQNTSNPYNTTAILTHLETLFPENPTEKKINLCVALLDLSGNSKLARHTLNIILNQLKTKRRKPHENH